MKEIRKGDLVQGLKPWNKFARLGVVISEPLESSCDQDKYKIFWYAPDQSSGDLVVKRTFVLEELLGSIKKMERKKCPKQTKKKD